MKLALKVDVASWRGMREGVPALVDMLERHQAGATFFFCVGPDHSGRTLGRTPPPGSAGAASRSLQRPGFAARLYGMLWPGPDLGRRGGELMRAVGAAGFETGVQAYDAVGWRNWVAGAKPAWTAAALQRAVDRYGQVFGEPPRAHAAAGWQTNLHALRLTQRLGFDYCSDGRGTYPHLPVHNAELIRCPQFPTTLPTLDELLAEPGVTVDNVAAHLLALTERTLPEPQVFTLRADFEGLSLAREFERLLVGWKAQGHALTTLRTLYQAVEPLALPRCDVAMGHVPHRAGVLLVQGDEFLPPVDLSEAA